MQKRSTRQLGIGGITKEEAADLLDVKHEADAIAERVRDPLSFDVVQDIFSRGSVPGTLSPRELMNMGAVPEMHRLQLLTKMLPWEIVGRVCFQSLKRMAWYEGIDGDIERHLKFPAESNLEFLRGLGISTPVREFTFCKCLDWWFRGSADWGWAILGMSRTLDMETESDHGRWQLNKLRDILRKAENDGLDEA